MIQKRLAAACLLALGFAAPAFAQQGDVPEFESELEAPSANSNNPAPLPGEPVISINMPASPSDLLTGLLATRALIEICELPLDIAIGNAMDADQADFVARLQLAPDAADATYEQIRTATEARTPDCAEGSPDRQGVEAVLSAYRDILPATAAAPAN